MVRVDRISSLKGLVPTANLRLPKLPPEVVVRTLLFFRRVCEQHKSEAAVLLHYSQETEEYQLCCPNQTVSSASVRYDSDERFEGYQLVGSIHSHCDFSAFHSGTDRCDEHDFDGLHITIGRVGQPYFTISSSVVVNGNRFPVQPDDVIVGIRKVDWKPKPRMTYRREVVPKEEPGLLDFGLIGVVGLILGFDDSFLWGLDEQLVEKQVVDTFYDMILPDGQDYRHVGFPRGWMDKVTKEKPVLAAAKALTGKNPYVSPTVPKGGGAGSDQEAQSKEWRAAYAD